MASEKNGWIKLHRKMLDNPIIMKDADHLAIWMYLLLNATHAEYPALFKGQKIMLQPGQLITGRKSIAEKLVINESKVRRVLDSFESDQQIDRQRSNQNTLISLINWDRYQCFDQQNDQPVTNDRPTSDQPVTTNKNVKNNKNDKNDKKLYSDDALLNTAIVDFIEFRKKIKKPMTDRAVSLMLGKLYKMTSNVNEQIEILNQSIMNGWQGIFPLKNQSNQRSARTEPTPKWMPSEQNKYDFDELERSLVANQSPTPELSPEYKKRVEDLKKELGVV